MIPKAYENKVDEKKCLIRLYEKYVNLRRKDPKCSKDFYLRPLPKQKKDVWYSCQPLGIHKISNTVSRMCEKAGIDGFKTNHSLIATAASRLYNQKVDEQLICGRTGHRSNSVRAYKRTGEGQLKNKQNTVK